MAETGSEPPQTPATPRWMRIALLVSLSLNLAVGGLLLGAAFRDDPETHRRAGRDVAAAPFIMAFAPEDRRAVIGELREQASSLFQNRQDLRERFEALMVAITAPEFDREAVAALMSKQREVATLRQSIGEQAVLDRIEAMSQAEREAYAERLRTSLKRRPPPRR